MPRSRAIASPIRPFDGDAGPRACRAAIARSADGGRAGTGRRLVPRPSPTPPLAEVVEVPRLPMTRRPSRARSAWTSGSLGPPIELERSARCRPRTRPSSPRLRGSLERAARRRPPGRRSGPTARAPPRAPSRPPPTRRADGASRAASSSASNASAQAPAASQWRARSAIAAFGLGSPSPGCRSRRVAIRRWSLDAARPAARRRRRPRGGGRGGTG